MSSHCRDLDKDPVACVEIELGWTLHHQSGHTRRKDRPCLDHRRPTAKVDIHSPDCLVNEPSGEWSDNPEPALRGMKDDDWKVWPVEQVSEVEYFKVASAADEGKGTDEDDCHDCHQCNAGGIGETLNYNLNLDLNLLSSTCLE